jgi:hypothetical protein
MQWIFFHFLLKLPDSRFELSVFACESFVRRVIDDNIRIDSMPLDYPLALRPVAAEFGGGSHSLIKQLIVKIQTYGSAPGPRSYYLA